MALKMEIIEGIEVYRIDNELVYTGGYDEVDKVDDYAVMRRKESGWWGDQRYNTSDRLSGDDLKSTLAKMSSKMLLCSISESISGLDSPGVYMYINKFTKKMYIGSAVGQTILRRQQQHLCSASRKKGQVGKFDLELSKCFNAAEWDFLAQPMKKEILNEERELILKYRSYIDQIGYNTQVPGGY